MFKSNSIGLRRWWWKRWWKKQWFRIKKCYQSNTLIQINIVPEIYTCYSLFNLVSSLIHREPNFVVWAKSQYAMIYLSHYFTLLFSLSLSLCISSSFALCVPRMNSKLAWICGICLYFLIRIISNVETKDKTYFLQNFWLPIEIEGRTIL